MPKIAVTLVVLAALAAAAPSARSQNAAVTVQVDAAAGQHPINPLVYGVAFADDNALADLRVPLHRWGGNNTSRYNWKIDADNRGLDWYFESVPLGSGTAGASADDFIARSHNASAQAMMTVPIIGWVGKLGSNRAKLASFSSVKYGAQADCDWTWFPEACNGVRTDGTEITGNDPNDASVLVDAQYQKEWVQHLVARFGSASVGGLRYYILDNEHSIWQGTHRDVHPEGARMEEVRDLMLDHAARIKEVDPAALVVGPEEWGWGGYLLSGYDQQYGALHGWDQSPDKDAHGGMDYLPWLLDQFDASQTASGKRLLDVFTVHFYPQGGEYGDGTANSVQLLRNRSTRSLWDPSYVDESWIGQPVRLIPRLKEWVSTYYPGTQTGITEYNWGAEGHINGATTQADILGIFGREGLDLATRWTTPAATTPTYKAIKMYRNYDGAGSGFGDVSVSASVPNPDVLSAFAATRSTDGALTIMVVSKALSGTTPVTVALSDFIPGGPAQVWRLTASNAISHLADVPTTVDGFSTTVPSPSITLFVVPGTAQTGPLVQFSASVASVNESTATHTVTVTRTGDTSAQVTVDYAATSGTATAGEDYGLASGTLTLAEGQASATFSVSIINDSLHEPNETIVLALSNPAGGAELGAQATMTLTIVDDDTAGVLQFAAAATSVSETGPSAVITVTRTAGTASGIAVSYATSNGTATAGQDYAAASGTLSFGAGQTSATFAVPITDDTAVEANETVNVTLSNPQGGATLGTTRTAVLTIVDNDTIIEFGSAAVTVKESLSSVAIPVKRTGRLASSLTVEYFTANGTAIAGSDYRSAAGTLTFGPGLRVKNVVVPLIPDTLDEPAETFLVQLRNPSVGTLGISQTTVTITDDDAGGVVQFSAATYSVSEKTATATITLTRTGGAASGVTVTYATSDGTATVGSDYTATSGTLAFGAGQATRTFTIPVVDDTLAEGVETVNLALSGASGGTILGPRATSVLRIVDDELTLELSAATYGVTEGANATVAVQRSGRLSGVVTVHYATSDGTGRAGTDYTARQGTLTFAANVARLVIAIPTTNDTLNENSKTFNLALDSPGGITLGHQTSAVVTINDNDPAGVVEFAKASYSVSEAGGAATIWLLRNGGTASGVTVTYSTADGTAVAGSDYTASPGTLTFGAGQRLLLFKVPILNDALVEGNETIALGLGTVAGGGMLGARSAATLTIVDNDKP